MLLLAGYFVARQIEKWVDRTLAKLDFNRVAKEGGLADGLERAEPSLDPVHAVGKLAFWLVMLVVILLASTALGLESINEMFGLMLGFLPTLISAIVIVILGIVVGEFVRGLIVASALIGGSLGLLLAGFLVDRGWSYGATMAVLATAQVVTATIVFVTYPETAHKTLEEINPEDA